MRSLTNIVLLFFVASLAGGCATGFKATHDHDSSHDFSGYKSFAWISANPMKVGPSVQSPNPLLEPRIMRAVESALAAKGFSQVAEPKSADFVLSFTVGSREQIKVQNTYPTMSVGYATGYPSHWGWGASYHCCARDTEVRQYTTGILAIDVFDVQEKRPVWHGAASKTINESDRENIEATVKAAVDAVLAGFPPQ
jgi:hypothetical protein